MIDEKIKIAISGCLLGINCKYDGHSNYNELVQELKKEYELIPICPEVLGGLPIPRVPSEIVNDKVYNKDMVDVTSNYNYGASCALDILKANDIKIAILKSKSPSCGKGLVYDGSFTHTLTKGDGVTTKLFLLNGIKVLNEFEIESLLKK